MLFWKDSLKGASAHGVLREFVQSRVLQRAKVQNKNCEDFPKGSGEFVPWEPPSAFPVEAGCAVKTAGQGGGRKVEQVHETRATPGKQAHQDRPSDIHGWTRLKVALCFVCSELSRHQLLWEAFLDPVYYCVGSLALNPQNP